MNRAIYYHLSYGIIIASETTRKKDEMVKREKNSFQNFSHLIITFAH